MGVRDVMSQLMKDNHTSEHLNISTEMIDFQVNDYVVSRLNEIFANLISEINTRSKSLKNSEGLHKDSICSDWIKQIDYVLTERFGMTYKSIAVKEGNMYAGAAWFSITPKSDMAISNKDYGQLIKMYTDYAKQTEKHKEANKSYSEIDVIDFGTQQNIVAWVHQQKKSIDTLKSTLKESSVTIDRKNAKIMGLTKDYVNFISHDIYGYVRYYNLTAQELTAVLLHEVGHSFTYIEYLYRSIANTSVLVDTFLENLEKKNKTPKESLIIAFEKSTGKKAPELKQTNKLAASIYILDTFMKLNKYNSVESYHSVSDSEQLADQFAGRFGCSADIMTALDKFYHGGKSSIKKTSRSHFEAGSFCILLTIMDVILKIICVVVLIPILIIVMLISWIFSFLFGYGPGYDNPVSPIPSLGLDNTYDNLRRRYMRGRNELIRRIRAAGISKQEVAIVISNIENIDKLIDVLGPEKVGLVESFFRRFGSKTKKLLEVRTVEQLIEDLSENNLYLASARLQSKLS